MSASPRDMTPEATGADVLPPTPVSAGASKTASKTKTKAKPAAKDGETKKKNPPNHMLWTIALAATDINWEDVAQRAGYKNPKSAADSFRAMKTRYLKTLDDDASADGGDEEAAAPAKANKRKAKADTDTKPAAKRTRKTKAAVKAEEEAEDDEE